MPKRLPPIVDGKKPCSKCKEIKPVSEFTKHHTQSTGMYPQCNACRKHYELTRGRRSPEQRAAKNALNRARHAANPAKSMWYDAKKRAKAFGVPFEIDISDIVIPDTCPILYTRLVVGGGDCSPSLDRVVPEMGYVRGNVRVISKLANLMKNKANVDQLERFAKWAMEETLKIRIRMQRARLRAA